MKSSFPSEFEGFYRNCLNELKARPNWTEAFVPMLERYVTITSKLTELNAEIVDEEIVVEHTNKAKQKNEATSPKWRMFLMLNREASALAKELKLSPATAPADGKVKGKKEFDLSKMKIA